MAWIKVFDELNIEAGFSTRETTSDAKRASLIDECKVSGGMVVRPRLVHGKRIAVINEITDSYIEIPETDGCITNVPGVTLTSTHGDCLAVYAYDRKTGAVGLCHAGWKGTLLGIAKEMIVAMGREYGSVPGDISCYISPGISKCCFEVSDDVRDAFLAELPWSVEYVSEKGNGKYLIDLKGINQRWLESVFVEDVQVSPLCTCCEKGMFYSYRRDKDAERMLAWIRCEER